MKLALVGAGSSRLPLMLASVARTAREASIAEVALYDARPDRIQALLPVGKVLAAACGTLPRVRVCASADEALDGAGAAILTARPGFEEARARDERACLDRGVIGQETTGPAGFAFAARSIPVAIEVGRLAVARSPGCLLVVFMNPAGLVTQALHRAGIGNAVGVCDSASAAAEAVARRAGFAPPEVEIGVAGLNHLSWTLDVRAGDRDVLAEALEDEGFLRTTFPWFSPATLRDRGCIPNEYLVYYYRAADVLAAMRREALTRGEVLEREHAALFRDLGDLAARGATGEAVVRYAAYLTRRNDTYLDYARVGAPTEARGPVASVPEALEVLRASVGGYAEVAMDVLRAMRGGRSRRLVLNVPGGGVLAGLDPDDVVEVTCEVGPDGVRPLPGPWRLPADDARLVTRVKDYERLAIRAVFEGSLALAEDALAAHPLVPTRDLARALAEALLAGTLGPRSVPFRPE